MTASTALGAGLRGVRQGDVENKVWQSIHPLQHHYDGERRARVLVPRGGFDAELSSSAGFFGSRSDFFWVSLFGLSLGFIWARVSLSQGGFGAILRAAGRVRQNSFESG